MSAARFAAEIDEEYRRVVEERLMLVTQRVALEALRRVVEKTPVDSGRARGNWQVSAGAPSFSTLERDDKQPLGAPPGAATVVQADAALAAVDAPVVVYVQNNLPYIERLEAGHSKQAPTGMVALTVAELETMFQVIE